MNSGAGVVKMMICKLFIVYCFFLLICHFQFSMIRSNRIRHYGYKISRYSNDIARYKMLKHKNTSPNAERYVVTRFIIITY